MQVQHDALQPDAVAFRGYQVNLARIAGERDTLIVLPTGLGKTIIALLIMADSLRSGAQRVLFLAPTKPLAEQHGRTLTRLLAPAHAATVKVLTGAVAPTTRADTWKEPGIFVATPQVVQNDVVQGRLNLAGLDLTIFDEAHRATGDYAYTFLGEELRRKAPTGRRLGLTASPGHDIAKIDEVRRNLGLHHVEIRTPTDPDVKPYVQTVAMDWETLPLPPGMSRVTQRLRAAMDERVRDLKSNDLLKGVGSKPSRRDLLALTGTIEALVRSSRDPDPKWFRARSVQAQALKLHHAIELAETQGSLAFLDYMEKMRNGTSKAARVLCQDPRVIEATQIAKFADEENPKLGRVGTLVQEALEHEQEGKVIVFAQYRATCERIVEHLARLPGVKPVLFVGQAKRDGTGMTQKEQQATLQAFRGKELNVLVATSVAEEGLDIPATDLVVFYEPIPSEIRSIQRRGRTGRHGDGRVVILMTKGTADEGAHWIAKRKEQKMIQELQSLRYRLQTGAGVAGQEMAGAPAPSDARGRQTQLSSPEAPSRPSSPSAGVPANQAASMSANKDSTEATGAGGPRIVCDSREQAGGVVRRLHAAGASIETRTLEVGDYILSDRVAVERKSCDDLVESLLDGRLFAQAKALATYPKPIIILEGESPGAGRGLHPDAITGALASLTVDFGIPVVQTRNADETSAWLLAVARREQGRQGRPVAIRPGPGPMDDLERSLFILAGLPDISGVLARRLLDRFGSVRAVFQAAESELQEVEGIGAARAAAIAAIVDYVPPPRATETVQ